MRNNLHELFPAPEVYNKGPLTMVTLTSRRQTTQTATSDGGVLDEAAAKTVGVLSNRKSAGV